MKRLLITSLILSAFCGSISAQTRLFTTYKDSVPYRIPAITCCNDGRVIAVADYRYCGSDIGFGPIDLHYRTSFDNGHSWSEEKILADGTGDENQIRWDYAFGDCCITADHESNNVLALCVGGKTVFFNARRDNPNRIVRFRSSDNGKTWDKGEEITESIYKLFDARKQGPVNSLFFGSGKICQSRKVKVGDYYRLYAAILTRSGVYAMYSDDFGDSWNVLGSIDESPCPGGDEPKCEELPDGSVLLSVRTEGRLFNVFHFEDVHKATGKWDKDCAAEAFAGIKNSCNGEILYVDALSKDNSNVGLLIQSVPFGPQRTNLGFFYKVIDNSKSYTASEIASDWKPGLQIKDGLGAYSTMTMQSDGRIGFLYESGPTIYNIDYMSLSVSEITGGSYRLR